MASVEQLQNEIARLKKDEADLRKKVSDAQGQAAKARASARDNKRAPLGPHPRRLFEATFAMRRASKRRRLTRKRAADAGKKLADNSAKQATKVKALKAATREAQRRRDREDERRRQSKKRHAQEIARLSRPTVRYVHEIRVIDPPKPERLRVLYLAANPGMVVIGEGPAEDLDDYSGYNKLRQSSAGDIVLECAAGVAHVYIANQYYSVDFLQQECMPNTTYGKYIGTLPCGED